jgi:Cu(I)/Ag(I) efflux system membrane protein CusA/SilA
MTQPLDQPRGPIAAVIAWCAGNPLPTIAAVLVLALAGWQALRHVPLDAIPDLGDTQVIVFSDWAGRSPDLVEDQVTYPITSALISAPKVKAVRGQSFQGLSFVSVIFADGTDVYWARARVLEYLSGVQGRMPAGVTPTLGPDATGVGWVFEYALVDRSGRNDLAALRSLQDFHLRYWLGSVEGVAEVASVGGAIRQYQVNVDPVKLQGYRLGIAEVADAVRKANNDVGGRMIEIAGHEHAIRGRGYVRSTADLGRVPVKTGANGVAVLVQDVATVEIGRDWNRGVAELDGEGETVGGIVVMRVGENALTVIERVKARLEEARRSLPEGVELVVTYDRSDLIKAAIGTLTRTLVEELVVVSLVVALFMLHLRSALIPIIALPIAVLLAFIPMVGQHLTANLMSLGGIAVAIGAMVDAAIILVDNVHRRLASAGAGATVGATTGGERRAAIVAAMQEVGPSVFFALLVITVSFLPVFTLQETEGRLFRPLAFTKTYAMGAAALLAVTLIPALMVLLIRGRMRDESHNPLSRWLSAAYAPVVRWVVRRPLTVIAGAVLMVGATVPVALGLQGEFMPPLNEGTILYMPTSPPGISVTEATDVLQRMDAEIKAFPEVERVFGKMGSADSATDPAPLNMAETVVTLKPRSAWRPGMTFEKLVRELDAKLVYPGMPNIWWMPIQTRTDMLATGLRAPLGIKLFGPALADIERAGVAIERALAEDPRTAPYTRSAFADRLTGGFYLDITPRREEAARYGLAIADLNTLIETAIGGERLGTTIEGRERYGISLRFAREFRESPEAIARIPVTTPAGGTVPLAQVADIRSSTGPMMVATEGGQLVGLVLIASDGIGLADYVAAAGPVIAQHVALPAGVRMQWAGQYQHWQSAAERLLVVVPITLALVALLLWLGTRSWTETGIILLALPFSLIGAVWLMWFLEYKLSVAAWVGMIALAGLDAETAIVMLLYLTIAHGQRLKEGRLRTAADLEEAIVEGSARRIRPKVMTALCLLIGLLPVMWSDGTGADVTKRIAAPMVGGIVTSFLLELLVYPAIFARWKRGTVTGPGR